MPTENLTSRIEKNIARIGAKKGCNQGQINTILALVRTIREEGVVTIKQLENCFEILGGEKDN